MPDPAPTRRAWLETVGATLAGAVAGAGWSSAQGPAGAPALGRSTRPPLPPRGDLVNTFEFEGQARLTLPPQTYALITGSDRRAFDRITLRPRMMVPTTDLDLSVALFGRTHATPILVAPIDRQQRFHPDGELATARGASAAGAAVIVPVQAGTPLDAVATAARAGGRAQVFANEVDAPATAARAHAAGCDAVCLTIGAVSGVAATQVARAAKTDWRAVDRVRSGVNAPIVVKGITTPDMAREALRHGVHGLIVSDYGGVLATAGALVLALPAILDAVGGRVPVLIDGGFRRGTDIIKALALGARAVLVGRPVMWGLAAYGADGVQTVLELLQTELARYMCMCGRAALADLAPDVVRVHAARPGAPHARA